MIRLAVLAALLASGASADPLAGRVAGPPRECVSPTTLGGPGIERDGTIIYRETGRRWWVTRPIGPCPALRPLTTLIVDIESGQLCRNDRFRVLEPGISIPSAPCRFDRFTPYEKR